MPAYRPSIVCNIKMTFDEKLLPNPDAPTAQSVDDTADAVAVTAPPQPQPQILSTGSAVSFIMGRVPKSMTLELPGYRQAATFTAQFDWRDFPLDPRTARAIALEIHGGAISDADWSAGITRSATANNPKRSVLQTRTASGDINLSTLLQVCTVDEWDVVHDTSGSVITIKGRDMRAFLIDTPIGTDPVRAARFLNEIDLAEPINVVVAQILSLNRLFGEFFVQVNEEEWPNGVVPAPADRKVIPRARAGAKGKRKAARPSLPSGLDHINFWDLIVKFCYLVGAIPYFRGTTLVIRPSRSIFDQQRAGFDPLIATPFAGGKPRSIDALSNKAINPPLTVRKLLYGRDVKVMSFNRKFGGYQRPKVVRAVTIAQDGTNEDNSQFLEAFWPPKGITAKLTTKMAPSATKAEEEILNVTVPGITSVDRLQDIAQSVYEEVGRGEMGGSAESPNLASFGGDNSDPDLMRLQPGDGVYLDINIAALRTNSPLISTLIDTSRTPFSEAVQALTSQLGDPNLARAIVATARGQVGDLQRFFRVSTVRYSWNHDHGINIAFDFQNYVVARNQIGTVSSKPGSVTTTAAATR